MVTVDSKRLNTNFINETIREPLSYLPGEEILYYATDAILACIEISNQGI